MKWGLFGGTFDPIHMGHLRCAEEILEMFNLNRIIFVPASRPPHKLEAEITPFFHREQMVKLAIEDNPSFSFADVENQREGKSYSVETIEYFLNRYLKDMELYFILGQDAFHAIQTWREWDRLLLLCHMVVMTRPGYENRGLTGILPEDFASRFSYEEELGGYRGPTGHLIYFREVTFLDIASSNIRQRAKASQSIAYLVPGAVRRYIVKNELYKSRTL
ncbi:MAG: nicotinate-nicotinamide nucleotide adenylyltransferase [Deltaproteobacteria bacterium HGW-Deltaproteobacteria-19]|jgi:nicotinate-nucleotide adenylyltransferase|nr:MAG: nicotinate-nicotinamide nucleotide adenylyltransferase [Deltaproteobacteria bacterium HGW-Deltaproteobacteria-19]